MRCYAVIVAYNPDTSTLIKLCEAITLQNYLVVIIDNSENDNSCNQDYFGKYPVISLKENKGVAYAQNVGTRYAINEGAQVISFFDQDSVIPADLLHKLVAPHEANKLVITAPVSIDKYNRLEYPSRVLNDSGLTQNVYSKDKKELVPVDIVISSGITASVDVFKIAGMFDEDFFIDFVDTEWCIRCRKNGVHILIVPDAIMEHSIGESSVKFGFFKGILHSPVRTYYKTRNSILLVRKDVKILFALRQITSAVAHNLLLVFFAKQPLLHSKYYLLGILHGVLGKTGKYQG